MTTGFDGIFAKLVPRNYAAQVSFSEAYNYVDENNTVHLNFMQREDKKPIRASSEPVEDSTEYETYPDTDTATADPRIDKTISNLGHFVLSLDRIRAPAMPLLGWRAGRGSSKQTDRGVDLLLARPSAISSKSLASVHMLFRFNGRSGFLMLMGGSNKVPVEVKGSNCQWTELNVGEQMLLYQSTTVLRAGLCEYELEYIVEGKHREAYFAQLDKLLVKMGKAKELSFHTFRKFPGDDCAQRGKYLEFETKGAGAFG